MLGRPSNAGCRLDSSNPIPRATSEQNWALRIGAAERDRSVLDVLAHDARESGDLVLRDPYLGAQFRESAIEGDLCDVALCFDRRNAVFEGFV
jgi:hypothetical protein